MSNSVTDKFTSKLERKDTDALQGFVPGFTVPYKTILDGNNVKMEMSKSFAMDKNAFNVDYNTSYNIAKSEFFLINLPVKNSLKTVKNIAISQNEL